MPTMGLGRTIPFGFPDKIVTKLRYHDIQTLTSTTGAIARYVFKWNSTFDPDFTGTGHQPLYRDNFAGIYNHYSVVSATAKITVVNTSAVAYLVGAVTDDDTTAAVNRDTLCEQTHGTHFFVPALTGAPSMKVWNMNWDCQKILGIDPYVTESYKTPVGADPSEQSALIIWGVPADGFSSASLLFDIELVQTVMFSELQTPVQS